MSLLAWATDAGGGASTAQIILYSIGAVAIVAALIVSIFVIVRDKKQRRNDRAEAERQLKQIKQDADQGDADKDE